MKKGILKIIGAAVLAVLVAGVWTLMRYVTDNRQANFGRKAEIYVYPGDSAGQVFEIICDSAEVKRRGSLERMFRKKRVAEYLTPGHYTVSPDKSSAYVARMLNNGWQTPVRMTLAGNLRIKGNIAAKISDQLLIDSAAVHAALNDSLMLAGYGFTPATVFALLMPATYEIYWTSDAAGIFDCMKRNYDSYWTEQNKARAEDVGLDMMKVSILASIVEAETNVASEMPLIAGVYLNRLKRGMLLQADPTVAFCFDYEPRRILRAHLEVDSPYNTYKYPGLPPGPICVPSRAALDAVLNPDYGGEPGNGNLYFCASADFSGRHVFARTYSEHNRNAIAFRREMNRRGIR